MIEVVLPVLNEAQALPWVLHRMPGGYSPIVVDNGSTDGSDALAASMGACVVREAERGFGAACFAGLWAAATEVICFMDCDGSLDPQELPRVADPVVAGHADLVLGRRVAERAAWSAHARAANAALVRLLGRRSGLHLSDIGPMRAARRVDLIGLDMKDRRFGWPLEMVLRAHAAGWLISEVPIPYRQRTGRSKVTGTFAGALTTVWDMVRALR